MELVPGHRYDRPPDASESWCADVLEPLAASDVPPWIALFDRMGGRHLGQLVAIERDRGEIIVKGITGPRHVPFRDVAGIAVLRQPPRAR